MRTHETKPMNINGAVLTSEILEQIKNMEAEESAVAYCENLDFLKDFFIKYLGGERPEVDMQKLIGILTDVTYLHTFMKSLIIETEEAAV
jgi:hypothetical protein